MKRTVLGGVSAIALLLAVNSGAVAADYAEPVPVLGWEGFYIGGHVGLGEADFDGRYKTDSDEEIGPEDPNGLVLGAHAGYNFQMDSIVFGIEVDASHLGWDDTNQLNLPPPEDNTANIVTEADWLASVRARLGVAFDTVHLYVTGGFAYLDASADVADSDEFAFFDLADWGGVAGGGIEWMATERVSLRAEGLYYFFNESFHDFSDILDSSGVTEDFIELDALGIIRVGASFHF